MATKTNKEIIVLTDEQVYEVADFISASCNKVTPETVERNRKLFFRDIIQKQYRFQGGVMATLESKFGNETAMHITNLVLQRISTPELFRTTANLERVGA